MTTTENQIVVYQPNETVRLDVRIENRTVWLSQKQMAELFGCSSENIIVHLKKIYREGELSEAATAKENLVVQTAESKACVSRIPDLPRMRGKLSWSHCRPLSAVDNSAAPDIFQTSTK